MRCGPVPTWSTDVMTSTEFKFLLHIKFKVKLKTVSNHSLHREQSDRENQLRVFLKKPKQNVWRAQHQIIKWKDVPVWWGCSLTLFKGGTSWRWSMCDALMKQDVQQSSRWWPYRSHCGNRMENSHRFTNVLGVPVRETNPVGISFPYPSAAVVKIFDLSLLQVFIHQS